MSLSTPALVPPENEQHSIQCHFRIVRDQIHTAPRGQKLQPSHSGWVRWHGPNIVEPSDLGPREAKIPHPYIQKWLGPSFHHPNVCDVLNILLLLNRELTVWNPMKPIESPIFLGLPLEKRRPRPGPFRAACSME